MKNFILDVDGVLATGQFLYSSKGKSYKIFGPHDSDGLNLLKDKINILFITSDKRGFPISKKRVNDMGFKIEFVPTEGKYNFVRDNFGFENTIYMGDGLPDVRIIRDCRFGIAPSNARIEAKRVADYITHSRGGDGAVCDACLKIRKTFFEQKPKSPKFSDTIRFFLLGLLITPWLFLAGIIDLIGEKESYGQKRKIDIGEVIFSIIILACLGYFVCLVYQILKYKIIV